MTRWLLLCVPLFLLPLSCGGSRTDRGPAAEGVTGEDVLAESTVAASEPSEAEPVVEAESVAPPPAPSPAARNDHPPKESVKARTSPPPAPPVREPDPPVPSERTEERVAGRSAPPDAEAASADEIPMVDWPKELFEPVSARPETVPRRAPAVVIPPSPPRPGEMTPDWVERTVTAESPAPTAVEPREYTLPEGTVIEIRLAHSLSTERNRTGDSFQAILERDLEADGEILFRRGAVVEGRITEAIEPGRVKGRAVLSLALSRIPVDDERAYALETNVVTLEAESTAGSDAKKVGTATAVGTALGAILGGRRGAAVGAAAGAGAGAGEVLLTRGRHVELSRERLFSFRLERDLVVEPGR